MRPTISRNGCRTTSPSLTRALDLTLINVDREQAAGSFSIDLVAEDGIVLESEANKSVVAARVN
jgi:hypothetical protein